MFSNLPATKSGEISSRFARNPFVNLREEMDDLIHSFSHSWDPNWMSKEMTPALDLCETETTFEVHMDLPGVNASEIDIEVTGDILCIKGEHHEEREEEGKTFHHMERHCGSFRRTVKLPMAIDDSHVEADFCDGVLCVTLPKAEECKSHKIEIRKSH